MVIFQFYLVINLEFAFIKLIIIYHINDYKSKFLPTKENKNLYESNNIIY